MEPVSGAVALFLPPIASPGWHQAASSLTLGRLAVCDASASRPHPLILAPACLSLLGCRCSSATGTGLGVPLSHLLSGLTSGAQRSHRVVMASRAVHVVQGFPGFPPLSPAGLSFQGTGATSGLWSPGHWGQERCLRLHSGLEFGNAGTVLGTWLMLPLSPCSQWSRPS